MRRSLFVGCSALAILFILAGCSKLVSTKPDDEREPSNLPYKIEVVAQGLEVPWAIEQAPDGRLFVTERSGRIRVIENGKLVGPSVFAFSEPFTSEAEGGLLGIALDPLFNENHYIYVYHSYKDQGTLKNRVVRLVESNNKARLDKVLIAGLPGGSIHNGGRLKVGPDGYLYFTIGDAANPPNAQDPKVLAGKIMRIKMDGTIPQDNPIAGSPVFSYGHRNPQGIAWQPGSGLLFASEHGQSAHDEINVIEKGANYGWPVIQGSDTKQGMKTPLIHSGTETWAPSGMTFVSNGPWKGNLLAANLRGVQILRLTTGTKDNALVFLSKQSLFKEEYGRIRDVYEGPDGSVYFLTNNRDGRGSVKQGDDRIIRLKPN